MFSHHRSGRGARSAAPRFRGAAGGLASAVALALALALALITGCGTSADTNGSTSGQTVSSAAPAEEAQPVQPPVGAPPLAASTPVRIEIPSIGVDSDLIGLGLEPDGTMEVPRGGFPGGWYTGSPTPGEMGPSVIAGHVDWGGSPGVFSRLTELSGGESVVVSRADGSVATFSVSVVEQYPKSEFPTGSVYGDIDHAGLRLITCGGDFDSDAASYDDNIVVYAGLVA